MTNTDPPIKGIAAWTKLTHALGYSARTSLLRSRRLRVGIRRLAGGKG